MLSFGDNLSAISYNYARFGSEAYLPAADNVPDTPVLDFALLDTANDFSRVLYLESIKHFDGKPHISHGKTRCKILRNAVCAHYETS